ncbi:MAG: MOSC domain-containing protein [Acidimicrobiia bacterium]
MTGTIEAVFIAAAAGEAMQPVDEVLAFTDRGLDGDRYATRRGYWTDVDECQVTLIQAEDLDAITAGSGPPGVRGVHGVAVAHGEHRRNLVTRDVDLRGLAGWRFRVGEAVFHYDRPRPPCRYIEGITEPGMTRALAARRGGICARVVESGLIREGDTIELLEQDSFIERVAGPLLRWPARD